MAGGAGTRLSSLTQGSSKHLLPIAGKPMIYYPLSVLQSADFHAVLLITNPGDLTHYPRLLGDGAQLGLRLSYLVQPQPGGIAQGLILGEPFYRHEPVCLMLGDNFFHGPSLREQMIRAKKNQQGTTLFCSPVQNASAFGVVELDEQGEVLSLQEKPAHPRSHLAVTGLYFYQQDAAQMAKSQVPSDNGELEITAVNQAYWRQGQLSVEKLKSDVFWCDMGTPQGIKQVTRFLNEGYPPMGRRS